MTGRPPLPWWKRKQPTLIAEAARRAGLTATARLEGWLEIRDAEGTEVAAARCSQDTGAMRNAWGYSVDDHSVHRFRVDSVAYFTGREAVDGFTTWIADGRHDSRDAEGKVRQNRNDTMAEQINRAMYPDGDERPAAPVTDITSRRRKR